MQPPYHFDQIIDRSHTNSFKWDNVSYAGKDMLPMPVADMDFPVAHEIKACLDAISEHQIVHAVGAGVRWLERAAIPLCT